MFSNLARDISVTNNFLSTNRDTGKRINVDYTYNINQFVEAAVGNKDSNPCRTFVDLLLDESFSTSDIQIKNVCNNDRRSIYVRDNDLLKLALQFINDPRHVLYMENVEEEETLIDKLKTRFIGKNSDLVLTIRSFDAHKFDDAYKYAKNKYWSNDSIEKLYKYIDYKDYLLGKLIKLEHIIYKDYVHIIKIYEDENNVKRRLEYNVYSAEELSLYGYAHINNKGVLISDRVCDYSTLEEWVLRDIEERNYDEIFDYEKFKQEALNISHKYPELKSFDDLYNSDLTDLEKYDTMILYTLHEDDSINDDKRKYIRIIKVLKSLQEHLFNSYTRPVEYYNKFFSAAAEENKINYDDYVRICEEINDIDW